MPLPRILKLAPNRYQRRLELIHRGYVELLDFFGMSRSYGQLVSWGWLEKHEPVDWLDAYDGHRPTEAGLKYLHYDEAHHLILIRPSKVEEVQHRLSFHWQVVAEEALVSFANEIALAKAKGWEDRPNEEEAPGYAEALARFQRRGYVLLADFLQQHHMSTDELIVAGVLRCLEHRNPDRLANLDVGHKAKRCLMASTRWQRFFVRPGKEMELLALTTIREA